MDIVSNVRKTMKGLINSTKELTTSRTQDVFAEVAFNFSFDRITFGINPRQIGSFTIQYVVSPKPESTSTAPSVTYDEIISKFDSLKSQAFIDAGLNLIDYSYEQSDVVADPTTGSVSLGFTINITVTEKRT
ncbi:hypothetical protein RJ495_005095 [Pluralibacter gergoviae]|nr:hypothetical protein [Pluralibacter gergoviae]ELD4303981.1 hypothetical protein [Pluralibacter gergoviae]